MGTPFAVLTAPEPRRPRAKREQMPVKNAAEKVTQAKPDQSVPPAWDAMKDSVRAAVASQLSHPGALAILKCSRCLGQMRLIACIEEPDVAKKILQHLGLRAEPLPTLRAQAPPVTLELFHEA